MNPELKAWLLGTLPENDRDVIALRLLTEDDLLGEIESIEIELIDSYARCDLNPADTARVGARLVASPRGVEQLRVAKAMLARKSGPRRAWAAAAALVLLCGGGATLMMQDRRPPAATPDLPTVNLNLAAVRGDAHVPLLRIASSGLTRFMVNLGPMPEGAKVQLQEPGHKTETLPISAGDGSFVFSPVTGRYQLEITANGKLIAAGEFDVVR
jgi:hypothetical protein